MEWQWAPLKPELFLNLLLALPTPHPTSNALEEAHIYVQCQGQSWPSSALPVQDVCGGISKYLSSWLRFWSLVKDGSGGGE